jgi:hypothetical protein
MSEKSRKEISRIESEKPHWTPDEIIWAGFLAGMGLFVIVSILAIAFHL